MLLKSLEIQGFKTFPEKTKLTFEDGISAVVGPNGSGKSNISDAMRWVLGEQSAKSLRCVKMEDVIFNGTPNKKSQGFAEVTLTIDNRGRILPYDGDTVAVTRRYYRSGDSDYLINKATVRLKDIHELFMDTGLGRDGYSMIGQGKIDSVISAKSDERREIFEEAAGISRFRYRKEEAERRLKKAEENLLRLKDILQELEGRVEPLRKQSEKAQKYLALYEQKKGLEIGLWLDTLSRSGDLLKEQTDRLAIVSNQHEEISAEIEQLENQIDVLFQQSNKCIAEAEGMRTEASTLENEANSNKNKATVLINDVRHNEASINRLTGDINDLTKEQSELKAEFAQKEESIKDIDEKLSSVSKESVLLNQKKQELQKSLDFGTEQIQSANQRLSQLSEESRGAQIAATSAESSVNEIDLRVQAIDETIESINDTVDSLNIKLKQQREELRKAVENETETAKASEQAEHEMNNLTELFDAKKDTVSSIDLDIRETGRRIKLLEDLEKNLDGFAYSVKSVMKMKDRGELSGIHGPVSRLIDTPSQYTVAVETALGGSAQHIIVENEVSAKNAIYALKKRDGGRATFLPLDTIKGKYLNEQDLSKFKGFVGICSDLCTCDSRYDNVRLSLLGRIAVADNMDNAAVIARAFRYSFRIVTLDGQVINSGGSMTGGSLARKNSLLSRAGEIKTLKAQEAEKIQLYNKEQSELEKLSGSKESLRQKILKLRLDHTISTEQKHVLDGAVRSTESELGSMELQLNGLKSEKEFILQRREALLKSNTDEKERIESIEKRSQSIKDELQRLTGGRAEALEKISEITAQLTALDMQVLSLTKDKDSLGILIEQIKDRIEKSCCQIEQSEQELYNLKEQNKSLIIEIDTANKKAEQLKKESEQALKAAEELLNKRMSIEQETVALRNKAKEKTASRELLATEYSRLEEKKNSIQLEYDRIIEQLWNEYELTRREAEEAYSVVENAAEAGRDLRTVKNQIKSLGSVNVNAIEEYKEVYERYTFLSEQLNDVEQSRDSLNKLIAELTKQMTEIFKERFQQINEYFKSTFRDLFGGGTGNLELDDPDDILNSGIRIMAQPPGKLVKNIELLSGGEKALVAISLYFAIMKVTPPPFCMLDEVEAALDDVNVTRFADYLRKMSGNTQFIIITHRRGTMEESDVLYGVTMQEEGISKLLKLDPSKINENVLNQEVH